MNCHNVQQSLSAHLDGWLTADELRHVSLHLRQCRDCAVVAEQLARVRQAVGRLPARTVPPELTTVLRVIASRELARRQVRRSMMAYLSGRFKLWTDNLMRPLALPLAGGLISALVLFVMLVPSILLHRNQIINDVPIFKVYREATVTSPAPFGFSDEFVLEVMIDPRGQMVDYSITSGPELIGNPALRRSIENTLLFTDFSPATTFGQPTASRIFVSFRRSQINVGS